jgi:Raf kinase inhibitor-like YbhB/YbcL family protein
MKLISSNFENNQKIPVKFTGDGKNINPNLEILNAPEDAKSFVLIVEDITSNKPFIHWIVFNIHPETMKIFEKSIPGIQGKNSWGKNEYLGPKPLFGTHSYVFTVYALNSELELSEGANMQELENSMKNHILDKAELTGLYK